METLGKILTSAWAVVISATILLVVYVYNPSPVQVLQLKTFDKHVYDVLSPKADEVAKVAQYSFIKIHRELILNSNVSNTYN